MAVPARRTSSARRNKRRSSVWKLSVLTVQHTQYLIRYVQAAVITTARKLLLKKKHNKCVSLS